MGRNFGLFPANLGGTEDARSPRMAVVKRYRDLWAWRTGDSFKRQVFALVRASPEAFSNFKFRD